MREAGAYVAWGGAKEGAYGALPCLGADAELLPKPSCTPSSTHPRGFLPGPFAGRVGELHNGP